VWKEIRMKLVTTALRAPATKLARLVLLAPFIVPACGELDDHASNDAVEEVTSALATDAMTNPAGTHRTIVNGGTAAVDTSNPFFKSLGTNGRACVTCHQPSAGWSITPSQIQAVFDATQGNDPLFRPVDGANDPNAAVGTLAQRSSAYSLLRTKGLIRVGMTLPATREFDVIRIVDPYGFQVPANTGLSFYRRPLPSANLKFLSAVMWDGREQTGATIADRLLVQANDATRGHAQGAVDLTATQAQQIVTFETALTVAQETDNVIRIGDGGSATGRLGPTLTNDTAANGGLGGPLQLSRQTFFIGINDPLGGNPQNTPFDSRAFSVFDGFINLAPGAPSSSSDARRAAIRRGQNIFNTRPINIQGVRGVNDVVQGNINATLVGTCTTCHDSPNVGDHSVALPLDLGLSSAAINGDNALPLFTVRNRTTGEEVQTTDLGRAMVTGKWANLSTFKGPILRALSARAPYFHNGSAKTLADIVKFYDTRFHMGLQAQEQSDLQAFLEAL
jgi:cytochrome c peroxidase